MKVSISKNKIEKTIILTASIYALVFSLLHAWNNVGYMHLDEFAQIIEFAAYKTGVNKLSDLAWEYAAEVRPGLQPLIAYCGMLIAKFVHINFPLNVDRIFKTSSVLFAFCSLLFYYRCFKDELITFGERFFYWGFALMLWFAPFLLARFSSENWSGASLLFALGFYHKAIKKNNVSAFILFGFMSGIAFQFRFQTAVIVASVMLYALIIDKIKLENFVQIIAGGIFALLIGFACDYWLYGHPVFPAVNYFDYNILRGVANRYGTEPFYFYYFELFVDIFQVLAWLVTAVILVNLTGYYKFPETWAFVAFLILHAAIPHKEMRFLFPLIYFMPLMLARTWKIVRPFTQMKIVRISLCMGLATLMIFNCCCTAVSSQKPTEWGRFHVLEYLHQNHYQDVVDLIYFSEANPLRPGNANVPLKFYMSPIRVREYKIKNIRELAILTKALKGKHIVLLCNYYAIWSGVQENDIQKIGFVKTLESVPEFVCKKNLGVNSVGKVYYHWFDQGCVTWVYEASAN